MLLRRGGHCVTGAVAGVESVAVAVHVPVDDKFRRVKGPLPCMVRFALIAVEGSPPKPAFAIRVFLR